MSSTRSFYSPGVFAATATVGVPSSPIAGTAYRDPTISLADVNQGWAYATAVPSDVFNQIMFSYSSVLDMVDRQGVPGWSSARDYAVNAIQMGSDGALYQAILANGPSTSVQDPITATSYWAPMPGRVATNTEARALALNTRALSPANLGNVFASGSNANGRWMRRPDGYTEQRGNVTFGAGSDGADVTLTFPTAFTSAATVTIVATVRGVSGLIVGVTSNTTTGATMRISQRTAAAFSAGSIDYVAIGA